MFRYIIFQLRSHPALYGNYVGIENARVKRRIRQTIDTLHTVRKIVDFDCLQVRNYCFDIHRSALSLKIIDIKLKSMRRNAISLLYLLLLILWLPLYTVFSNSWMHAHSKKIFGARDNTIKEKRNVRNLRNHIERIDKFVYSVGDNCFLRMKRG